MPNYFAFAVFLLLTACGSLRGQDFVIKKDFDKRSERRYNTARSLSQKMETKAAIAELDALLEREPRAIDAYLLRGRLYYDLKVYDKAETDLEQVLAFSDQHDIKAIYQAGLAEYYQAKYTEAVAHFEHYLEVGSDRRRQRVERYLRNAQVAAELKANPVPFEPQSVGEGINTPGKEYLPSISADGQLMVYTVNYDGQEDFYYSLRDTDGSWLPGQLLSGVHTPANEGAQSIAADGKLLFFTGCHWPDTYGGCDLYYAYRTPEGWSNLRHAAKPVNSEAWDSQPSISGNGDVLYLTSTRAGGLGKSDIWRAERKEDGTFGRPENLGPVINTDLDERSPFIHPDGRTLYFASDGHPGLGGFDIFITRLQADGSWSEPENLGYPINSTKEESTLIVSLDGKTAYYTTDQNTSPGGDLDLDIYQFELYDAMRPAPVTYVQGTVTDAQTGELLVDTPVQLLLDTTIFVDLTTRADGTFLVVLPLGKDYGMEVSREGYFFYSDRFELKESTSREEPLQLSIPLRKIPAAGPIPTTEDVPIVLRNVLFAIGSAELLPMSETELNRLADLLMTYPQLRIRINGHTDNVGDDESNLILSQQRAQAVVTYLQAKDIAPERLQSQGFGESRPIADNETEAGRRLNRRTEFEVLGE